MHCSFVEQGWSLTPIMRIDKDKGKSSNMISNHTYQVGGWVGIETWTTPWPFLMVVIFTIFSLHYIWNHHILCLIRHKALKLCGTSQFHWNVNFQLHWEDDSWERWEHRMLISRIRFYYVCVFSNSASTIKRRKCFLSVSSSHWNSNFALCNALNMEQTSKAHGW